MKLTLASPRSTALPTNPFLSLPYLLLTVFCVTAYYAKKHSGRLNFTAAICGAAASLPKCNVYATQAKNAQPLLPLRFGNKWACTMSTLSAASLSASKKRRRNGYVRICRRFIKIKIGNSSRFAKACGCSVCRRLKIGARNVVLDVCGQPEMDGQAHGEDAVSWLAMQTEIQMFLHTHPINQAREQQGLPEINGLWLWNDADGTQPADIVASDSAWARFSDTPKLDAPYDLKAWFKMVQETGNTVSDGLIFLDDLVSTLQTGDVWAYKDILESWENRWFAPLWDALDSGRLKTVCIATDGENGGTLEIGRRSKWVFWRKAKNV